MTTSHISPHSPLYSSVIRKREKITLTFAVTDVAKHHIRNGEHVSYRVIASALRYFVT